MANILVIDDDAEFLDMMRLLLGRDGHQTILSAEAPDGLNKALSNPPDLAIIDVMMSGVTGYEICRKLRASPITASIPIIILTARGQTVDRQAALDSGADEHLTKPVTIEDLRNHINELLAKHAPTPKKLPSFRGTLALLSLRGGVGVTTLAVNLATALAQAGGKVCLVDLCASSGHVALQLGLRPEPNWSGLVKVSLSAEIVEAHLLQHDCGLRVLAAPIYPVVGQGLSRATAQATLKILQQRFPIVVVDMPSVLNETAIAAIEAATLVALVITAEAPSIQTAVGTLRTLQGMDKFQIILNHIAPGDQLAVAAIERALKRPMQATLPFDSAQVQALARRAPLTLQNPTSPLAQAVQELAQSLAVSR